MKIIYSLNYQIDLKDHVFPTEKYALVKEKLLEENICTEKDFLTSPEAAARDILLVHTPEYLAKLENGTLSPQEILTLELPYSKELVSASRFCVGGTILAAETALNEKTAVHLGGGFHHAFRDHGEGFCVFNDVAVALRVLERDKKIERFLIIDCDLHQGNGTASIFSGDSNVFTFSIHQENNYPALKPAGSLDIGLADGTGDKTYLKLLKEHIPGIIEKFKPQFIFYVAGADPYCEDQLGGLKLTKEGLLQRDEIVFKEAHQNNIPVATVLAGGYAHRLEDTVDIHFKTVCAALKVVSG